MHRRIAQTHAFWGSEAAPPRIASGEMDNALLGRELELETCERFVAAAAGAGALLLEGEAGIGKTAVWRVALEQARACGWRSLRCVGDQAEARLAFVGLVDLLGDVGGDALAGLPVPQRQALEVALLRAEPGPAPPAERALSLGLLNTLRALAEREPLLIAIDDVQWLDVGSADALAFAARRLERERIRFLLTRRAGAASSLEAALERRALERLELAPLSFGAIQHMLVDRLGLSLPRRVARQIHEATGGNPLFALEVGRTLVGREPPRIGEELPIPSRVEDALGMRVGELPPEGRRLLLAIALGGDLSLAQLAQLVGSAVLERALDDVLVVADGERIRPSHPLLAAAALARARPAERRALHRELAATVADEQLRVRHLALASDQPDEPLAARLAAAAARVAARGAAVDAVVLAEHALRLTPPGADSWPDRVLALASYLVVAGENAALASLLERALDELPPGPPRVKALLLLRESARSVAESQRLLQRALAESEGDRALRAFVLAEGAADRAVVGVERIPEAEAWALEALPVARASGVDLERHVLQSLAWARALRGAAVDDVCERFAGLSRDAFYLAGSPDRIAAQRRVWRGEIDPARECLTQLRSLAEERGELVSFALARLHLCELALRVGDLAQAAALLDEWAEPSERDVLLLPMYERCRALLAAERGEPEQAGRWVAESLARAAAVGDVWDRLEALRARGMAELVARDPAEAAAALREVWEHTARAGVDDPGAFPVAPDLVEALAELGELAAATSVTARLRELATAQEHPWGLATADRCEGIVRLASRSYDADAAALLEQAAAAYDALALRFDGARTLLGLGRGLRRHRKWAAARSALTRAAAAFDEIGSTGWAAAARAELERIGARRPRPSGELTPTERRVVELAAAGHSNKEIASALVVTVHTVEVHLSHAYAKLGVRSRSQLARAISPS